MSFALFVTHLRILQSKKMKKGNDLSVIRNTEFPDAIMNVHIDSTVVSRVHREKVGVSANFFRI